jgi:hypothetical protein
MHWLLEPEVFGDSPHPLAGAAQRAGHGVTFWRDEWWSTGALPEIDDERVVFHGSLGNAARVAALGRWSPGAYCDVERLRCSAWYPAVGQWRLNERYVVTTVRALCERPREVAAGLGSGLERAFVRPDGPLKPFGGRVVTLEGLTPQALDHGFYYDDLELPIVVAPVTALYEEWRFVVVHGAVVGSSGYHAAGRRAATTKIPAEATALAKEIVAVLPAPDPAYVLDLARTEAGLRLVELNPFSGSDLYGCDRDAIVAAVATAE